MAAYYLCSGRSGRLLKNSETTVLNAATTAIMQKIRGRYSGRYMAAMATTGTFNSSEDKYPFMTR